MEDLGAININIREMRSGGGGGVFPGGGVSPGGGGQPGMGPGRSPAPPAPFALKLPILDKLVNAANIAGELRSFVTGPTIAGFNSLLQGGGAMATAISAMGAAAAPLIPIIGGVVLATAGAVMALKGLQAAAASTAERVAAVGRFSGAVISAQMQERFAALNRTLREAAANGALYAMSQRAATAASDATARVSTEYNRALAVGSIIWNRLVEMTMRLMYPIARIVGLLADFAGALMGLADMLNMDLVETWIRQTTEPIVRILDAAIGFHQGFGPFTWLRDAVMRILEALGVIGANTRPSVAANVNGWFMDDMRAITRTHYGRIGNERRVTTQFVPPKPRSR